MRAITRKIAQRGENPPTCPMPIDYSQVGTFKVTRQQNRYEQQILNKKEK